MAQSKRKLAAILSADVVCYSRLMQDDQAATVETLGEYRRAIACVIARHDGHVVNAPGDNILAEFLSAVDAAQATVEIQTNIEGRNTELPDRGRMQFRVVGTEAARARRPISDRRGVTTTGRSSSCTGSLRAAASITFGRK